MFIIIISAVLLVYNDWQIGIDRMQRQHLSISAECMSWKGLEKIAQQQQRRDGR